MIAFVVLAALVVGGALGVLLRHRSGRTGTVGRPSEGTTNPTAHAGYTNSAPFDGNP